MSKSYKLQEAKPVAEFMLAQLILAADRIMIAGDVMAGNKNCSGAHIRLVPTKQQRRRGVFGFEAVDLVEEKLAWLLNRRILVKNLDGYVHVPSGVPVKIEPVSLENWV